MVSVYEMCVMVMECIIKQREMCYLVNRSHHTAVCAVQTKQQLPYSSMCCTDQTAVVIQLSVLYRPNSSCHTAVCAVLTKQQLPYTCLCCTDQTAVAIQLSVLYRPNSSCHTAVCAVLTKLLTATQSSSQYLFTTLMFPTIKSQSQYIRIFYVPFSYSFPTCTFHFITAFNLLQ